MISWERLAGEYRHWACIELIPNPQPGADLFLRSAGQAIMDFTQQNPTWDVVIVLYKPGIYLMAKRIWGGRI